MCNTATSPDRPIYSELIQSLAGGNSYTVDSEPHPYLRTLVAWSKAGKLAIHPARHVGLDLMTSMTVMPTREGVTFFNELLGWRRQRVS